MVCILILAPLNLYVMKTDTPIYRLLFAVFIIGLFSCNQQKEKKNVLSFAPKVVEAHGYIVPKDSVAQPKVILVGKPKIVPVGKPKVITIPTNVHVISNPKIVLAGVPKVCTPGQDSFSLPKTVPAIERPFIVGKPEKVIAKEATSKDPNPYSFSSFGKQQGLNYLGIRSIFEDYAGNLWFGTVGGGVDRYDGKYFTHFTTKEGLPNNLVGGMAEDHSGNLWFTTTGGVCRYDGYYFTNFTEKEGLSHNVVIPMLKDRFGNLWFGTNDGGVNRYDGHSFTHYTKKEGLPNNTVNGMFEDRSGNLWFGTNGGVSRYDGKSFTNFTEKEGLSHNTVRSILEDRAGNLWFGTNGGVCCYEGQFFTHFTVKEGLTHNIVWTILQDRTGNLWFGTGGGVSRYDGKTFTHFTVKEGLCQNIVFSSLEDRSGNLWFGTFDGGVSRYDGHTFTHFTDKEGLSNNAVFSMVEDRSGNLWFGTTGGGVNRYDGKTFAQFTEKEGLPHNMVRSMLKDHNGNLWIGSEGEGISRYDGKTLTRFTEKDGLSNNLIRGSIEDHAGNLWIGTLRGGVTRYDGKSFTQFTVKEGLSNNVVRCILEDRSGNLWFGTWGGGVSRYDGHTFTHFTEKEGLLSNDIRSMLEDSGGNIWFGTNGKGVSRYDGQFFTHFTEKEGLANNDVVSILEDSHGNIWFGTGSGLSFLSKTKLNALSIQKTQKDILDSGIIFKNYTYESGFIGIGCNESAILEAKDGRIWIGANDRLSVFNPKGGLADTVAPNLVLTGLALFNEDIPWINLISKESSKQTPVVKDTGFVLGNGVRVAEFEFEDVTPWYGLPMNLSLAHNNNYLTFIFTGITVFQPKEVKYQYKLEGIDDNWSLLTNRNEATYGNLPPGHYTFKVKARNSEGYWSKEVTYNFTIRPPWWRTWWAYVLYAVFIGGSILFIYRFQLNRSLEQAEALRLKELDAVKTKLYTNITHEFRTPLTVILGMAKQALDNPKEYVQEGLKMIIRNGQNLLTLVNQMLDLSKLESGKLTLHYQQGDIVTFLKYIAESFHSLAENKGVQIHFLTDAERLNMDFDKMRLQQVVSNLLSNAIKFTPKGGHIYVSIDRQNNTLVLKIKDTGIGIAEMDIPYIFDRFYQADDSHTRHGEGTGIGLALTRELVKLMEGTIVVKSIPNEGTEFEVTLPIRHIADISEGIPMEKETKEEAAQFQAVKYIIDAPISHEHDSLSIVNESNVNDKPLVLIADDNEDVRTYLAACLKMDYSLEIAKNGQECEDLAFNTTPDLIVLDVMMPFKDGFEVCKTLKNDERTSHIPIIMLTAKADLDSKLEGLECGADAYLMKPFHKEELLLRIKKLLELRQQLQQHYRSLAVFTEGADTSHSEDKIVNSLENAFVIKVRKIVEAHLTDYNLDAEKLSRALTLSRSQVHRKLSALTGLSATSFIRYVRLVKAKELLLNSGFSITAIAYDSGFNDPAYFSRVFKQEFGVTPQAWREENLSQNE